jgi:putative ABC transport system permease protein
VSQEQLRDQVDELLPDRFVARAGDVVAEKTQEEIGTALGFINTFLLVFAGVALVVGSFLIINTFSILVAQRSKEMALLRALGASRRQVTGSVLMEALAVGLLGSTLGLALGFLLAIGLRSLFAVIGLDVASAGLVFQPRTAAVAYLVGLVVTVVAAYIPARRASRVAPVAALHDDVAAPEASVRRRSIVGGVLVVLGAGLMAAGLVATGSRGAAFVGAGVLGVLLGVTLLSPLLSRPLLSVLGRLYRPFGTPGVLATQNTRRNPRRTAATASALMIGLALVSAMSVLGASTNASLDEAIGDTLVADYVVSNALGVPFSPTVAEQVAEVDGVDVVAPFRVAPARVGGENEFVAATHPPAFTEVVSLRSATGSLGRLSGASIALDTRAAERLDIGTGDRLRVDFPAGSDRLRVAATFEPTPAVGSFLVPIGVFDAASITPGDSYVYVLRQPGASSTQVYNAISEVVEKLPTVTLKDQQEFKDEQRASVNQLLYLIYALLGLAVVIAVLGIVNTLALSVIERTREVGLLRAVGMSRRQLRLMVRLESIAIAVLGAILGVIMGVGFGVVLQQAIAEQGIAVLAIPVGSLSLFVAIAAVVGVLAAVLPARRAARIDVLRAITSE